MYKKIKQIDYYIYNKSYKIIFVLWVILFVLSILLITATKKWPILLTYPENNYKNIESEAIQMVDNHNLETDLLCILNCYNNKTKQLSFDLFDTDSSASITVNVSDYNTDTQNINIKRSSSKLYNIFSNFFLLLFAIPLLISLLINIILSVISGLVHFIIFIFNKIKEKIKSKK